MNVFASCEKLMKKKFLPRNLSLKNVHKSIGFHIQTKIPLPTWRLIIVILNGY